MKRLVLVTIVLVIMSAGCGMRNTSWQFTDHVGARGERPRSVRVRSQSPNRDGQPNHDELPEDFDELEKELVFKMVEVPDPLEGWNRGVFVVNDALYVWVAKPVVRGFEAITPLPVRIGIRNVFRNLAMPVRAINCVLQGNWEGTGNEFARFGLNSTFGILGALDVAQDEFGIPPENADLGQTMAFYGLGEACYLVWPILGPGTLRDSVGWVGDRFMQPLIYINAVPWEVTAGAAGIKGLNDGSFRYPDYDALKEDALDPYVAARQAYVQYRRNLNVPDPVPH